MNGFLCLRNGCRGIVTDDVCNKCGPRPRLRDGRPSAHKRGYGKQWQKVSKIMRRSQPLCIDCLKAGRVTPAAGVHHKQKLRDAPELAFDEENLEPLCAGCHAKKDKGN